MSVSLAAYRGVSRLLTPLARPAVGWWRRSESPALRAERLAADAMPPVDYWWHAASLGEVAALAPVLDAAGFGERSDFVVTTTSATGRRLAERRWPGRAALAPLDLPPLVGRALHARRPRGLVLVETELWPNLLSAALEAGVRVGAVNARVSDRTWPVYRRWSGLFSPLLARFAAVAARSEEDAERWLELGVASEALRVTGNTKHDQVRAADPEPIPWSRAELLVAGSLRPGEEQAVLSAVLALRAGRPAFRAVLVPRHPDRWPNLERQVEALGLTVAGAGDPAAGGAAVLVERRPGRLAGWYAAAQAAFVGGTLVSVGGHNVLEPAAAGVPVVFGPHTANVKNDAAALVAGGGGARVADAVELIDVLSGWWDDPASRRDVGKRAEAVVDGLRGASRRSVDWLQERGVLTAEHAR